MCQGRTFIGSGGGWRAGTGDDNPNGYHVSVCCDMFSYFTKGVYKVSCCVNLNNIKGAEVFGAVISPRCLSLIEQGEVEERHERRPV